MLEIFIRSILYLRNFRVREKEKEGNRSLRRWSLSMIGWKIKKMDSDAYPELSPLSTADIRWHSYELTALYF